MTNMKLFFFALYSMPLAISASPIGSINPAILNNQNPTIWSQATVPTLKQEIKNLYNFNVALYNNRTIFGAAHLDCTAPEPPSYYGIEDICVESDISVAKAVQSVAVAWNSLGKAMFPVFYKLPDTALDKKASFSDFSHFYNHLLLEVEVLQNSTAYNICKGNFRKFSATWNATGAAYFDSLDILTVEFGPVYVDGNGQPVGGTNGTYVAYPLEGHFTKSIHLNSGRMETGWGNIRALMEYPTDQYSIDNCQALASAGIPKPLIPSALP